MGTLVTVDGTTCYGFTCYIGNTCARTTWTLEPLVTGLVEPLGPLMQGLLETPGLTVAGHLVNGQVKEAPNYPKMSENCFETLVYCLLTKRPRRKNKVNIRICESELNLFQLSKIMQTYMFCY
jgi:hypothetical protein